MKKRTKLVGLILLAALLTATFSGCSYEEEFQYRLAIKYGLIREHIEPVKFYFEKIGINIDASDCGQKEEQHGK